MLSSNLGLPEEAMQELAHVPSSSPLFHWVLQNRQAIQISDAEVDERVPEPIRRIPVANAPGLNRVSWDLRLPADEQARFERGLQIVLHKGSL